MNRKSLRFVRASHDMRFYKAFTLLQSFKNFWNRSEPLLLVTNIEFPYGIKLAMHGNSYLSEPYQILTQWF